jgi:hypothetical protein
MICVATAADHSVACTVFGEIERETEAGWLFSGHSSADSASGFFLLSQTVPGWLPRISARVGYMSVVEDGSSSCGHRPESQEMRLWEPNSSSGRVGWRLTSV